jgi:hypothetical protein
MRQPEIRMTGTSRRTIKFCREACYTDPGCSIWEYSPTEGCWYGYSDTCSSDVPGAKTMVAGERVARACVTSALVREQTDYLSVFGIIGAVAFLLFCGSTLVLICVPHFLKLGEDNGITSERDEE